MPDHPRNIVASVLSKVAVLLDPSRIRAGLRGAAVVISVLATLVLSLTASPARAQPLSPDATLSGLVLSTGTLSPAFSPAIEDYTVDLTLIRPGPINDPLPITVTPTAAHPGASLTVNGTPAASGSAFSVSLEPGVQAIEIEVEAEDGSTRTYSVSITFAPYNLRMPSVLEVGQTYQYRLPVNEIPVDMPSWMTLGATRILTVLPDEIGTFLYRFQINYASGYSAQFDQHLTVVAGPEDATLSDLVLSEGALEPAFARYTTSYAAAVPLTTEEITVTPTAAHPAAGITVNDDAVASGEASASIPLAEGPNTITVAVTAAEGGEIGTYTITVTRGSDTSDTDDTDTDIGIDLEAVERDVRSFTQSRMSLLSSHIGVPTLRDRRQTDGQVVATRLSPTAEGLLLGFAASRVQLDAFGDLDAEDHAPSAFNIWVDGTLSVHNRTDNSALWGTFGLLSGGIDYLVIDQALIGLSFHIDQMRDPLDRGVTLTGEGWLVGPYGSFEIGEGVFFDTSLLYGRSGNRIDAATFDGSFDTHRWLWDTSISGQWELDDLTTLSPRLRAVYLSETVADYAVSNAAGVTFILPGFSEEQLRVSAGAELRRRFLLENGLVLTPSIGFAGGFSGLGGSGAFGALSTGFSLANENNWTFDAGGSLNIEGDGRTSAGVRAGLGVSF